MPSADYKINTNLVEVIDVDWIEELKTFGIEVGLKLFGEEGQNGVVVIIPKKNKISEVLKSLNLNIK